MLAACAGSSLSVMMRTTIKEAGKINQLHQELCEKLKADLARAKEDHQYDKLIHQKELEDLRKK